MGEHTLGAFFPLDLPAANGAGAVLLPDLGGYRSLRKENISMRSLLIVC